MIIVVISAKAGGGKTTLANNLKAKYGMLLMVLKFAGPMYEIHDAWLNIMKKWGYVSRDKKDRSALQKIGDWGREKDPMIWVNIVKNFVNQCPSNMIFVIEDCRKINELRAFATHPYLLRVRLTADREVRKSRADAWYDEGHSTEVELDDHEASKLFDLIIETDRLSADETANTVIDEIDKLIQRKQNDLNGIEQPEQELVTIAPSTDSMEPG